MWAHKQLQLHLTFFYKFNWIFNENVAFFYWQKWIFNEKLVFFNWKNQFSTQITDTEFFKNKLLVFLTTMTTKSSFFTLNIRFLLHDLFEFHVFGLS
jgi:hypothetical protein